MITDREAQPLQVDLLSYQQVLVAQQKAHGLHADLWDPVRRIQTSMTPEEFVRQLLIQFVHESWAVGFGRMSAERGFHQTEGRRYDLLVHRRDRTCSLMAECKSFKIQMPKDIFWQLANYDHTLKVDYMLITNGKTTYLWDRIQARFITDSAKLKGLI